MTTSFDRRVVTLYEVNEAITRGKTEFKEPVQVKLNGRVYTRYHLKETYVPSCLDRTNCVSRFILCFPCWGSAALAGLCIPSCEELASDCTSLAQEPVQNTYFLENRWVKKDQFFHYHVLDSISTQTEIARDVQELGFDILNEEARKGKMAGLIRQGQATQARGHSYQAFHLPHTGSTHVLFAPEHQAALTMWGILIDPIDGRNIPIAQADEIMQEACLSYRPNKPLEHVNLSLNPSFETAVVDRPPPNERTALLS